MKDKPDEGSFFNEIVTSCLLFDVISVNAVVKQKNDNCA